MTENAGPEKPSDGPVRDEPLAMPPSESPQPPSYDSRFEERMARREARAQRRAERRSGSGAWIGGAVLILVGLVFLAQNFGITTIQNWWALFILIPAIGSLVTAYNLYRANDGTITTAVRGPLIGGLIMLLFALGFLFNVSFGLIVPLLLIAGGIALLLNTTNR